MIRYKNFAFFIQDDKIYVKDPRNNQVLMVRDAKNIDNQIELGRSMIEQYISDLEKSTELWERALKEKDALELAKVYFGE